MVGTRLKYDTCWNYQTGNLKHLWLILLNAVIKNVDTIKDQIDNFNRQMETIRKNKWNFKK